MRRWRTLFRRSYEPTETRCGLTSVAIDILTSVVVIVVAVFVIIPVIVRGGTVKPSPFNSRGFVEPTERGW